MTRRVVVLALLGALAVALAPAGALGASAARSDADHPKVRLQRVTADVDTGTGVASRAGDPTIYVAEQAGRVVAVRDGAVSAEPVIDLRSRTDAGGEQGLLGLAFAPDGNHLYVHFTNRAGNTRVEEYAVTHEADTPAVADVASRRVLLKVAQPESNHNGGQLAFGPDGNLYLGLGDGGNKRDEGDGHASGGNGQSQDTLLGKIVRVDLAGGGGTICDSGLRNPWRFSFDRDTGDLWIGDVGESDWEEIDRLPADGICGHNLGWNVFEGDTRFRSGEIAGGVPPVAPVAVLAHENGFCAVMGGSVYRGTKIPALEGWYVFSDYCDGTLRALRVVDGDVQERKLGAKAEAVTSFGQGDDGEIYVLSQFRGLFRIAARVEDRVSPSRPGASPRRDRRRGRRSPRRTAWSVAPLGRARAMVASGCPGRRWRRTTPSSPRHVAASAAARSSQPTTSAQPSRSSVPNVKGMSTPCAAPRAGAAQSNRYTKVRPPAAACASATRRLGTRIIASVRAASHTAPFVALVPSGARLVPRRRHERAPR